MSHEALNALISQNSWELVSPLTEVGRSLRARVKTSERIGLVFWFADAQLSKRAAWAHALEHAAQLFAVPELLESGENWILVENIQGEPLSEYLDGVHSSLLGYKGAPHILQELGELARKLHAMFPEISFYGDPSDASAQWLTFNGYVASRLEEWAEHVRSLGLADEGVQVVSKVIGDLRQELASFHPRSLTTICHRCLSPDHIWVSENAKDIVGLTGLENCAALPPEMDLAWILNVESVAESDDLVRHLYRGYGAARTMDVQRREYFYARVVALEALYAKPPEIHGNVENLLRLLEV